jgi:hypothetical protein
MATDQNLEAMIIDMESEATDILAMVTDVLVVTLAVEYDLLLIVLGFEDFFVIMID